MLTFASTNRLVTPFELPWVPSVERVTVWSAGFAPVSESWNAQTAVAVTVIAPAELFVIVTVHVRGPAPLPVGLLHVSDSVSGTDEKCGVIDVSDGVVPAGSAVVEIVNVCE